MLITVDEVINQIASDENADVRYILNCIVIAEERWIVPALGYEMYNDIVNQKNTVVTTGNQATLLASINASLVSKGKNPIQVSDIPPGTIVNAIELVTDAKYQQLWNQYLWKVTAECVDVLCIVPSWLRHTAQGQQKNNPVVIGGNTEGSATGDRKDVEYKVDNAIQSRINPMLAAMQKWICDTGGFTKYPAERCQCEQDGIPNNTGGIITGIYEDDDYPRRRRNRDY